MSNHKEVLWNVLENLRNEHFKNFQWFLKQNDIIEGFSAIAEARLERADRQDTVDLMVQKYGCRDTVEITITILEKIGRNDLAQCLSRQKGKVIKDKNIKWQKHSDQNLCVPALLCFRPKDP